MHFDKHKQFFTNESILANLGVNTKIKFLNQEEIEEKMAICPMCDEEKPLSEILADDMCDNCFAIEEAKRIEEDNNRWLKGIIL